MRSATARRSLGLSIPAGRNFKGTLSALIATALLLGLTACGPADPNIRPTDSQLKDAISLLIKNFTVKHPQLVTWKNAAVNKQLSEPLPKGYSTEAGYYIRWNSYTDGQLPEVYVPWDLIGQYPNTFQKDVVAYPSSAGRTVPSSVLQILRKSQLKNQAGDQYFAALVGVRYSTKDSHWIIFTTVPFLPVTDPAYGWATVVNSSWSIVDFGTATVGCGKVPPQVQSEFGYQCPIG